MSYTASLHHIVFATYRRQRTIENGRKEELFHYIWGIVKNKKSKLLRINAMPDHVHMLIDLHPTVALADLVGTVKQSTSLWMKQEGRHQMFDGWAKEYYAASVSPTAKDNVTSYINNQEAHHAKRPYADELRWLAEAAGMTWYDAEDG